MKRIREKFLPEILILIFVFVGCTFPGAKTQHFEEIPSMLNVLTNKAQIAVEEGLFNTGGEQAVLEYISNKSPNIMSWFAKRNYELKIGVITDIAVVLVCDQGKPIFEDTYCNPGAPDKDHSNSSLQSCEITMSEIEVTEICK